MTKVFTLREATSRLDLFFSQKSAEPPKREPAGPDDFLDMIQASLGLRISAETTATVDHLANMITHGLSDPALLLADALRRDGASSEMFQMAVRLSGQKRYIDPRRLDFFKRLLSLLVEACPWQRGVTSRGRDETVLEKRFDAGHNSRPASWAQQASGIEPTFLPDRTTFVLTPGCVVVHSMGEREVIFDAPSPGEPPDEVFLDNDNAAWWIAFSKIFAAPPSMPPLTGRELFTMLRGHLGEPSEALDEYQDDNSADTMLDLITAMTGSLLEHAQQRTSHANPVAVAAIDFPHSRETDPASDQAQDEDDSRYTRFPDLYNALMSESMPLPDTLEEFAWLDGIMRAEQKNWPGANLYFQSGPFRLEPGGVPMGNANQEELYAIRFGETKWRKLATMIRFEEGRRYLTLGDEPLSTLTLIRRPAAISARTTSDHFFLHVPADRTPMRQGTAMNLSLTQPVHRRSNLGTDTARRQRR
jgi:hypothetical protein